MEVMIRKERKGKLKRERESDFICIDVNLPGTEGSALDVGRYLHALLIVLNDASFLIPRTSSIGAEIALYTHGIRLESNIVIGEKGEEEGRKGVVKVQVKK
jgi:hypothetical protein